VLLGAYVRGGADAREVLAAETARTVELDEVRLIHLDCGEHQLRLVKELAVGRIALAEAAEDVLAAAQARPGWLVGLARTFPHDPDDRTRVARVLVAWVKELTAADPGRRCEAVGRVTAEFEEMTDAADD